MIGATPLLLLPLLLACAREVQGSYYTYEATLRIPDAKPLRDLPAFWSSTGFSAPSAQAAAEYLLSQEMEWNLAYIAASPRAAVRQVRAHWLLQLISASPHSSGWQWDFTLLDLFLDRLALNGLEPGFEIMGNPRVEREAKGGEVTRPARPEPAERPPLITNITEQEQLWVRLVRDTVIHCGGYMVYFRATVRGLREAERVLGARLRLGGPAGTFKGRAHHPICWHILEHCDRLASRNLSCGLDFITFHRKGRASASSVTSDTVRLLDQFWRMFPHLRHLPFANDEADPLTGWWREEAWRADGRYAGMVVNTVVDLQDQWRGRSGHRPALEILSNDNGFLETTPHHFQQRTLLSSFQLRGGRGRARGRDPPQLFRKSVLTAMAMLSFLEGEQIAVQLDSQVSPALA
ncbi:Alpha-L-iduronidase [Frankliniella fusca]|uniref:Alpha-L-iduronidase n=1 Tax=Frankliniella fusca TaxID=407009 RepID=A0AAE1HEL6_9NEOP|nr:Alpha-L-iduronidase [Frankliniella fusca]